jgi:two-component system nitrate/nitrite response regulator NarL
MSDVVGNSQMLDSGELSVRVLLADDSAIVRRGIRQLLAARTEIQIVGEATDFAETIRMAKDLHPEVVILDLHMPDETDLPAEEVKSHLNHGFRVLAISIWNGDDSKQLAESLGAAVLLDKMNLANTLIPTIMQLKGAHAASRIGKTRMRAKGRQSAEA